MASTHYPDTVALVGRESGLGCHVASNTQPWPDGSRQLPAGRTVDEQDPDSTKQHEGLHQGFFRRQRDDRHRRHFRRPAAAQMVDRDDHHRRHGRCLSLRQLGDPDLQCRGDPPRRAERQRRRRARSGQRRPERRFQRHRHPDPSAPVAQLSGPGHGGSRPLRRSGVQHHARGSRRPAQERLGQVLRAAARHRARLAAERMADHQRHRAGAGTGKCRTLSGPGGGARQFSRQRRVSERPGRLHHHRRLQLAQPGEGGTHRQPDRRDLRRRPAQQQDLRHGSDVVLASGSPGRARGRAAPGRGEGGRVSLDQPRRRERGPGHNPDPAGIVRSQSRSHRRPGRAGREAGEAAARARSSRLRTQPRTRSPRSPARP